MVYLCVIYASDAVRKSTILRLLNIAESAAPATLCAHSFIDESYNRTSFYLLSRSASSLCSTALHVCKEAFQLIDYKDHCGSHPALGAVDHICFSPLSTDPHVHEQTVQLSRQFSSSLNQSERLNIYYYGASSQACTSLRSIRKALGYFETPSKSLHLTGIDRSSSLRDFVSTSVIRPDLKGDMGDDSFLARGVACVGVVPMVRNFNIRFSAGSSSKEKRQMISNITSQIRVPNAVEALTLPWGDTRVEIACNLRSCLDEHSPSSILHKVQRLATDLQLDIESSYTTGPSEDELLEMLNVCVSGDHTPELKNNCC